MRILFLSRWLPFPADNGSKLRIFNLLRQLRHEHEIALVSFAEPGESLAAAAEGLAPYCSEVEIRPFRPYRATSARALAGLLSSEPRSLVDTWSAEFSAAIAGVRRRFHPDLVIASQLGALPYALAIPDVPILLEELEVSGYWDSAFRPGPWRQRARSLLTWLKLRSYLRRALPRLSACTVVSDRERDLVLQTVSDILNVEVVPNAVDLEQYATDYGSAEPASLVYAGALTYRANYDAVQHYLTDIHPVIARRVPGLAFRVTGSYQGVDLKALPSAPGVVFTGRVDDVRPVVARSWASVVPLRVGGGTRLKILESMALGTPVVATSKGAEGLDLQPGVDYLRADAPAAFAERVVELLDSAELRQKLARSARRVVEERYSWDVVGQDVRRLVRQATLASIG
jgi:glycosyltransferase involved in cell wall biosynthesis